MTTKLLTPTLVLLFLWAFVESGQFANFAGRFKRPPDRPAVRQIEVLKVTPEYRLVKHALGETRVPLRPKRIVSLTNSATDSLCALGVKPVLVSTS